MTPPITTAFHGLAAFRGGRDAIAKAQQAASLEHEELCVADAPIGSIGLVVAGVMRAVHDCDVWSEIGEDGLRYVRDCATTPSLTYPDHDSWAEYARERCRDAIASWLETVPDQRDQLAASLRATERMASWRAGTAYGAKLARIAETKRQAIADMDAALAGDPDAARACVDYCEGWMSYPTPLAVWITDERQRTAAQAIADALGVDVLTLHGHSRIWDIAPAMGGATPDPLPYEEHDCIA